MFAATSLRLSKFNDGKEVEGEHWVDELPFPEGERPDVYLRPSSKINPDAAEAIKQADVIVIAPGTLHASLIPNFQVEGMKEALAGCAAGPPPPAR